eukprot:s692_g22.t1
MAMLFKLLQHISCLFDLRMEYFHIERLVQRFQYTLVSRCWDGIMLDVRVNLLQEHSIFFRLLAVWCVWSSSFVEEP